MKTCRRKKSNKWILRGARSGGKISENTLSDCYIDCNRVYLGRWILEIALLLAPRRVVSTRMQFARVLATHRGANYIPLAGNLRLGNFKSCTYPL